MNTTREEYSSRRKFIKRATGTIVSLAWLPGSLLATLNGGKIKNDIAKEHIAAACGTYCGACPAYLAKHGSNEEKKLRLEKRASSPHKASKGIPDQSWMDGLLCDGCLSGGILAAHCQFCAIRKCASGKQTDSRCTGCEELPCYRVTGLISMGGYLHRNEYLPNLKKIHEMGVTEWVKYEETRWLCPKCSLPMSWYDAECSRCGEPRSSKLFPLA
ncbi:MAG TPA: DUF3795 domain-containing protein [Bacteroidales bacterium]|nr:DUF3795 domain-containing protein [Bacteroidales bacterium]